ncbi:MAG: ABC-2 transporter permease [Clostridia bacterium]|nr:ABC-2 transporter permease [Clostridia bacterium]
MKGLWKCEWEQFELSVRIFFAVIAAVWFLFSNPESLFDAYWPILVSLLFLTIGNTILEDEKNGWLTMQGVLPVTKRQYLLTKYLFFQIIFGAGVLYVFSLVVLRLALSGRMDLLTFLYPLPFMLSAVLIIFFIYSEFRYVKKGSLRHRLIRAVLFATVTGSNLVLFRLHDNEMWMSRLFPLGWCFLAVGVVACVLTAKKDLERFEGYQLGIPSELQTEKRKKKGRKI